MSQTITNGQSVRLSLSAGQSIAISSISGTYTAQVVDGAAKGTVLATNSTGGSTYGPYATGAVIVLAASADGVIDYDVGVTPVNAYDANLKGVYDANGDLVGLRTPAGGSVSVGVNSAETYPIAAFPILAAKSDGSYDVVAVPSPYAPGHVLHPSVLYFKDGKGGFRYWMAYTPYPNSDSTYENPCIAVSNDGKSWAAPAGVTNPIFEKPPRVGSYNSDTDLYWDSVGSQFVLLWRTIGEVIGTDVDLFISTSTDGIAWSARTNIFHGLTNVSDMASPSIWYNATSSKWEILAHNVGTGGTGALSKITSSSLLSGWDTALTVLTFVPPSGRKWWHSQLRRISDGSVIGFVQDNNGTVGASGLLYSVFSSDGAVFSYAPIDTQTDWYRPSFLIRDDISAGGYYVEFYGSKLLTAGLFRKIMRLEKGLVEKPFSVKAGLLGAAALALKPILTADTFARADDATTIGASTSGHAWTQISGPTNVLGISGNQCYPVTTGNCRSTRDVGVTDYLVRATFAVKQESYLIVRWIDSTNYLRVGINSAASTLRFERITAGSVALSTSLGATPAAGDDVVVRCIGSQITIWINDVFVASIVETQGLTSTTLGLAMATNITGRLDNFLATAL